MISLFKKKIKIEPLRREESVSHPELIRRLPTSWDEDDPLVKESRSVLGYTRMSDEQRLSKVLLALDIDILDQVLVDKYKTEMAEEANKRIAVDAQERWYWVNYGIGEYDAPIPQFVLRKAVAVKKIMPEAYLEVHALKLRHNSIFHPDPFLIVRLGSSVMTIEVWDEPKFENS